MTKSRVVAATVLILIALTKPAIAQDDLTDAQYAELSRALDMSVEEIRAMNLAPDDLQILLEGYTQAIVVVGSRAEARTITASAVPVDILSTSDLTRQGVFNLQEQLRTVVPSFNVNTQPISDASTVVRPAMLRNLAPDHTLVLVNGKRRHRSAIIDWHGGNGVAFGSQGPDISTIPAIALRQVEVLRDGAAAQYGSDAIAGVMNFQLKDAAAGGAVSLNAGTHLEGDGETYSVAANVGLPLGGGGFANLSLEYGSANPTNRSAPRGDAIALRAAGNTHVLSDTPQIWGSPEVDGDIKFFGNFGYTFDSGFQPYAHANFARKRVTGGFFFRNPNTRGGVFSGDGGQTLLVGDRQWAETGIPDAGHCPAVPIVDNVPDSNALAAVASDASCFTLYSRFPGGFTPNFGGEARDMSVVGGLRGVIGANFIWDASAAVGQHEVDSFHQQYRQRLAGIRHADRVRSGRQPAARDRPQLRRFIRPDRNGEHRRRRRVAARTVSNHPRRAGFLDGRSLRPRPGFLGRIQRLLRLRPPGRGHLGAGECRGVRRSRIQRCRRAMEDRRRGAL